MPASTLRKTALALALAAVLVTLGCSESVESLVASGEAALGKGDYRTAQIQLKSALQKDLNNARARWLLGELSLTIEDGAAAEKEIRRAGELGVGNDAVIPALAQALLLQGKVDEVLDLPQPPELSPRARGEVMAAQGLGLLAKGEKGRADELTVEALKLAPDNRFATTARVRVLASENKLDEAEQLLTNLQQKFPDYGLVWSLMGDIKDVRGDLPKAEEAYTSAIAKRFNDASDLLKRALIRLRQQNLDGALADAEQLNKAFPNLQAAWYVAGAAHFQKKDFPRAKEALDRSFQLNNDHLPTLILLGWSNLTLGNMGQAGEQARRAVALAPNLVGARLLMATIDLREGRGQRAEEMTRPVVDAFPDNLPAKSLLIASLQAQGRGAEAAPLLEQIAAASPDSLDVQTAVGEELLRAREPEKALTVLERAIAKAPEAPRVNAALVMALLQEKKFDEALQAATRFQEQNPRDIVALRLLATAQLTKGDQAAAEKTFRQALDVAPGDVVSSLRLSDLLTQKNDVAGARKIVEEAYAKHPNDGGLTVVMAQRAAAEGRADDARTLLRKAVELAPANPLPRLLLGRQLVIEKDPQGALDVLPRDADLKDPMTLETRAEAHIQLRQFEAARSDLERLVAILPNAAPVHFKLAAVYNALNRPDQMDKALSEAARLAPKDANIGLAKARALAARAKFDEAEKAITALGLPESELAVLETRLFIAERKGDKAELVRIAEALFAAAPKTQTVLALAGAQQASEQADKAEQTLKQWVANNPADEAVALALVKLYANDAKLAEAAALLRPVVERNPGNAGYLNNLAWYLQDSAPAEALTFAKRAQAAAPDNAGVMDTLAVVLAKNGKHEDALRAIDRAIELAREPAYFQLQRVEILIMAGDTTKAAEALDTIRSAGLPTNLKPKADALAQKLSTR